MKAAFFSEINKVELKEVKEPIIEKPNEVKIKIKNVGICASDVLGLMGLHPTRKPPVISGHEASGIVVEVGNEVQDFKIGDRVVIEPQYGCGECYACREGKYNVCQSKKVLGTINWSGAFAEYIIAPSSTLIRLPANMSFEMGALLEPLAVGMHAVKTAKVVKSSTAVIIGSGPIGIACMLGCICEGVAKTIMVDIQDYNLEIAKTLGADVIINSKKENPLAVIMKETNNLGADAIFIAVGTPTVINEAISMSKIGACLMTLAHFGSIPPELDFAKFRYKELTMKGTVMYTRKDYENCISAIVAGKINPLPMISKIYPLEDCIEAFDLAVSRKEDYVKLMFSL